MSDEIPELEGNDTFVPMDSTVVEESGISASVDEAAAGAQSNMPVEVERRKKRVSLYWKRPKSHLYEYNYDYGENYYKGMVDYLDVRGSGLKTTPPPAQSWAERALRTYSEKREAKKQSGASDPDVELLHKIRNNINTYTVHAKTYARKVTGHYTYN